MKNKKQVENKEEVSSEEEQKSSKSEIEIWSGAGDLLKKCDEEESKFLSRTIHTLNSSPMMKKLIETELSLNTVDEDGRLAIYSVDAQVFKRLAVMLDYFRKDSDSNFGIDRYVSREERDQAFELAAEKRKDLKRRIRIFCEDCDELVFIDRATAEGGRIDPSTSIRWKAKAGVPQ